MRKMGTNWNRKLGWTLALLIALAGILGAGLIGASGSPEDIGGAWDPNTPLAAATPSTACGSNLKCAEWCTLYQGGTSQPSGMLCCVPDTGGPIADFGACEAAPGGIRRP